jgi:hypothetical protein
MRGRPKLDPHDESVQVTLTLPARAYASLCSEARRTATSVPAVIRRSLVDEPANKPSKKSTRGAR